MSTRDFDLQHKCIQNLISCQTNRYINFIFFLTEQITGLFSSGALTAAAKTSTTVCPGLAGQRRTSCSTSLFSFSFSAACCFLTPSLSVFLQVYWAVDLSDCKSVFPCRNTRIGTRIGLNGRINKKNQYHLQIIKTFYQGVLIHITLER